MLGYSTDLTDMLVEICIASMETIGRYASRIDVKYKKIIQKFTLVEGLDKLICIGRTLYQSDENWTSIIHNISRSRKVWRRLGKLFRREGTDNQVLEIFYQALVRVIMFFFLGSWYM